MKTYTIRIEDNKNKTYAEVNATGKREKDAILHKVAMKNEAMYRIDPSDPRGYRKSGNRYTVTVS